METITIPLRGEYIALCDLIKLAGIANSGGQAKHMIDNDQVRVDGKPERRKTAKIRAGQSVSCLGQVVQVTLP